jgi:hypothetical protein
VGKHARHVTTYFSIANVGQHDEDRALDTLLGTEKGIAHLVEFIEVSNAFAKETVV